ncbi:MAG: DUF2283 domain-containing protein [bacterium]
MEKKSFFEFRVIEDGQDGVAYLRFSGSGDRKVDRTVRIRDLIQEYSGPDLYLDFSEDGVLLGLEVLG